MTDSFATQTTLEVDGKRYKYRQPGQARRKVRHQATALLDEDPSRESAAARRRLERHRKRKSKRSRTGTRRKNPTPKSPSCPRAWCCRISPAFPAWSIWPRCATRSCVWAAMPRRINPLIPSELVIDHSVQVDMFGTAGSLDAEREDRVRPQQGALRISALGPEGVQQFQSGAAAHRHRASGESGISSRAS